MLDVDPDNFRKFFPELGKRGKNFYTPNPIIISKRGEEIWKHCNEYERDLSAVCADQKLTPDETISSDYLQQTLKQLYLGYDRRSIHPEHRNNMI